MQESMAHFFALARTVTAVTVQPVLSNNDSNAPPIMPSDDMAASTRDNLNHAPGSGIRSIRTPIGLGYWVGHARGEHLPIRGGGRSGVTHAGCRASVFQNVVGGPDNRRGNRAICVYLYDFERHRCLAWRESMGPRFVIWRPSRRVPLDLDPAPCVFGSSRGVTFLGTRYRSSAPINGNRARAGEIASDECSMRAISQSLNCWTSAESSDNAPRGLQGQATHPVLSRSRCDNQTISRGR
jgi:hypothetical protein